VNTVIVKCSLNFDPLKVRAVCTSPLVGEAAMSASEMAGEGFMILLKHAQNTGGL
jgi:hypothetical protein